MHDHMSTYPGVVAHNTFGAGAGENAGRICCLAECERENDENAP